MKMNQSKVFLGAFLLLQAALPAFAQSASAPSVNGVANDDKTNKFDSIWINDVVNNPIEEFNGWSQAYEGYEKSPIIFDGKYDYKTRKYPDIAFDRNSRDTAPPGALTQNRASRQANSIRQLNLGVDDEIYKTSMIMYQPIFRLQSDFAGDKGERNRHLDLFKSVRGIATLTLSYLDKTVAAGLATVQQQADNNVTNQILKQIQWSSARLANPAREPLYVDAEEKVEQCIARRTNPLAVQGRMTGIDVCSNCLEPTNPVPPTSMGEGLYNYCVCCAETETGINGTTNNSPTTGNLYSLAERILYGFAGPVDVQTTETDKQTFVSRMLNYFRQIYGDVIMAPCRTEINNVYTQTNGLAPDANSCVSNKIETQLPFYTPADLISFFRNGSTCQNENCPLQDANVSAGICPGIKTVLMRMAFNVGGSAGSTPVAFRNDPVMNNALYQANLGEPLYAADFQMMMKLLTEQRGGSSVNNPLTWDPKSRFGRWLDEFCDASAVVAFKRYHYRMMATVENHLRMNRKATENEKTMARDLMARVTANIELAERDREARFASGRIRAGMSGEAGRQDLAQYTSAMEGSNAAALKAQLQAQTSNIGGSVTSVPVGSGG